MEQMEIEGRQALSATSATSRKSSRASKAWIPDSTSLNAASAPADPGMQIVKCTTRFATCMCVAIAVVKVGVYFRTEKDVVRTSALDSLGDLMANCMTLYTGYRMTKLDKKKYPVGQSKFQSIGCLVFSTFMFALMFGNALANIESLIEDKDEKGYQAISRFFYQTETLGGEFQVWHDSVNIKDQDKGEFEWTGDERINNPLKDFFEKKGDADEKELAKEMSKTITREEIVKETSDYENQAKKARDLIFQNAFLGACATYKLCLWLYCIKYAIPKSGSNVLVALANDKRNDFIGTYSVIFFTTIGFKMRDTLGDWEDKVDPFISLCLSFFIMASWIELMIEHMKILSQEAGCSTFQAEICEIIEKAVQGSPCGISSEDCIKAYVASEKHIIEVVLTVKDCATPFKDVAGTIYKVKGALMHKESVERVIVCVQSADLGW